VLFDYLKSVVFYIIGRNTTNAAPAPPTTPEHQNGKPGAFSADFL
jgi:hypothetical protein